MTRFDLHVHSRRSKDATGSVLELALAAQEAGLAGFAVTDHDAVQDMAELRVAMERTGLLIVPGIEVTTSEGHLLGFGVQEPVPKGIGMAEAVDAIEAQGGVAAAAHPLRVATGLGPAGLRAHAGRVVKVVEAMNARERRLVQENTRRLVEALGLAQVGGSDVHWVREMGTCWTRLDDAPATMQELLEALRAGRCAAEGGSLPRRQVWGHGLSVPARVVRRRRTKEGESAGQPPK